AGEQRHKRHSCAYCDYHRLSNTCWLDMREATRVRSRSDARSAVIARRGSALSTCIAADIPQKSRTSASSAVTKQ
ncbi:hypothetical protein AAVH_39177, partial [Aphelenchoides avenae]